LWVVETSDVCRVPRKNPGRFIGAWLGSSTRCLCEGQDASPSRYRLHVYDSFVWERWMDRLFDAAPEKRPRPGDSFLELFNTYMQGYQDRLILHPGYIEDGTKCPEKSLIWAYDEPVALVVYDMGPNPTILDAVWRQFSHHLVAGRSVVVFNEYGQLSSSHLWEFCRCHADHLAPHHKPHTTAKAFLYV
jgi:hypothetical protein